MGAVETIAAQSYNWGLQGLRLGSANAGTTSEMLIGKAQQLLPYCPELRHHESAMTLAYQRALELKSQEHEFLSAHSKKMDVA